MNEKKIISSKRINKETSKKTINSKSNLMNFSFDKDIENLVHKVTDKIVSSIIKKVTNQIVEQIAKTAVQQVAQKITKTAVDQVINKVTKSAIEKVVHNATKSAMDKAEKSALKPVSKVNVTDSKTLSNKAPVAAPKILSNKAPVAAPKTLSSKAPVMNAKPSLSEKLPTRTKVKSKDKFTTPKSNTTSKPSKINPTQNNEEIIRIHTFFKNKLGKDELVHNTDKILKVLKNNKLIKESLCTQPPSESISTDSLASKSQSINSDITITSLEPKIFVTQSNDTSEIIFELWINKSSDNEHMTKIYDTVQNAFYKAVEKKLCSDFAFLI